MELPCHPAYPCGEGVSSLDVQQVRTHLHPSWHCGTVALSLPCAPISLKKHFALVVNVDVGTSHLDESRSQFLMKQEG